MTVFKILMVLLLAIPAPAIAAPDPSSGCSGLEMDAEVAAHPEWRAGERLAFLTYLSSRGFAKITPGWIKPSPAQARFIKARWQNFLWFSRQTAKATRYTWNNFAWPTTRFLAVQAASRFRGAISAWRERRQEQSLAAAAEVYENAAGTTTVEKSGPTEGPLAGNGTQDALPRQSQLGAFLERGGELTGEAVTQSQLLVQTINDWYFLGRIGMSARRSSADQLETLNKLIGKELRDGQIHALELIEKLPFDQAVKLRARELRAGRVSNTLVLRAATELLDSLGFYSALDVLRAPIEAGMPLQEVAAVRKSALAHLAQVIATIGSASGRADIVAHTSLEMMERTFKDSKRPGESNLWRIVGRQLGEFEREKDFDRASLYFPHASPWTKLHRLREIWIFEQHLSKDLRTSLETIAMQDRLEDARKIAAAILRDPGNPQTQDVLIFLGIDRSAPESSGIAQVSALQSLADSFAGRVLPKAVASAVEEIRSFSPMTELRQVAGEILESR